MLSGSRLRGSRTKRAEKYVNEGTESTLVSDADSIKIFFENTPKVSTQRGRKTSMRENPSLNIENCDTIVFEGRTLAMDPSADVLEERKTEQEGQNQLATNTTFRSSRKAKDPVFLIEDREPCFSPEITTSLSSSLSDCKNDLFDTNFDRIHRINNTRKVESRLGGNLSQTTAEGWELGNKKDHNESNFRFSNSTNKGIKNYNDRHIGKTLKDDSQDDLVFSDIFRDKEKHTVSCTSSVNAKRQQTFRRVRSQPHNLNIPNRTKHHPFTDLSLSKDEISDKSTLREFPWGTSALDVLQPAGSIIRDRDPGESRPRSSPSGDSTTEDLSSEKDTKENSILEDESPKECLSELMEDSKDVVNKLNNSEGDKFTDKQGERSFVCLVDQLTDVRVRQKFDANHAGRRRHAVCEELEKVWVWNNKCLYEYRRDLNVRTALSNMFS